MVQSKRFLCVTDNSLFFLLFFTSKVFSTKKFTKLFLLDFVVKSYLPFPWHWICLLVWSLVNLKSWVFIAYPNTMQQNDKHFSAFTQPEKMYHSFTTLCKVFFVCWGCTLYLKHFIIATLTLQITFLKEVMVKIKCVYSLFWVTSYHLCGIKIRALTWPVQDFPFLNSPLVPGGITVVFLAFVYICCVYTYIHILSPFSSSLYLFPSYFVSFTIFPNLNFYLHIASLPTPLLITMYTCVLLMTSSVFLTSVFLLPFVLLLSQRN